MLLLLFLIFIVVPLAELYVIIQVGQPIGVLPTIGAAAGGLGPWLAADARAGPQRLAPLHGGHAGGPPPAREVLDGALVLLGGAFLLTPGFLTDILGVLLLLPPTRALVRAAAGAAPAAPHDRLDRRRPRRRAASAGAARGYDVEGTAHDVDAAEPRPAGDPRPR